jgi:hypothetical protein
MSAQMRAKVMVNGVQEHFADHTNMDKCGETLTMAPVCKNGAYPQDGSDEDNSFAMWTPSGSITLLVNNPALWGKFKQGDKMYVDFSPAE